MYVQYSERFPGLVLDVEQERIWVDREADLSSGLEQLYTAYLEEDLAYGAISGDYAAGLAHSAANVWARPWLSRGMSPGRSVGA